MVFVLIKLVLKIYDWIKKLFTHNFNSIFIIVNIKKWRLNNLKY